MGVQAIFVAYGIKTISIPAVQCRQVFCYIACRILYLIGCGGLVYVILYNVMSWTEMMKKGS